MRCLILIDMLRNGKAGITPHLIKQATIREHARLFHLNLFIETGTYLGEMVSAMRNTFSAIHSIELSDQLYRRAETKFKSYPHIQIWHGDSGVVLHEVLELVSKPALFWLDGHYSGGFSAKSDASTPIEAEIDTILNHNVHGHVILIDDARCFNGQDDYPQIATLKKRIEAKRPHFKFEVHEDIIRIHMDHS